jgi:membrane fusion protein (multidrug efflux system)
MLKRIGHVACVALILALAAGCGALVEGKANDPAERVDPLKAKVAQEVQIPVQTAKPDRRDVSAYFETTSRVTAENRVEVISKGTGQCLNVTVEVGDIVTAGQVLAELDSMELEAQIRQTRVNLAQQKSHMDLARRSFEEGLGPEVEYTNAKYAYEANQAVLELQEVQMSHQTIRAPIGGVLTQRALQTGMLVSTGMPTFSIVDPNSYVLPISIPEKELGRLRLEQTANVTIDSRQGETFEATIQRINPAVDPQSGTVGVLLRFHEEARQYLRESAFARVRLVMETHANALVVPKDTLIEENARKFLMVVEEQPPADAGAAPRLIARRVEIQTGLEDSDYVEVVNGIDENANIVTLGQHTLKPDSPVVITTAETEILSRAGISAKDALEAAQDKRQNLQEDGGDRRRERLMRR